MDDVTTVPYVDKKSGKWYVRVRVKGIKRRPCFSLQCPAEGGDVTTAVAQWRKMVLPDVVSDLRAKNGINAAGQSAGPRLRDLAEWYTRVHLPYLGRADKTIDHYERTLADFITYCGGRHVSRAQQLSGRIVQEWQLHVAEVKGREGTSRDQVLAVRHWLNDCEEAGEVKELPPIKWLVPKKKKSQRFKAYPADMVEAWTDGLMAWRPKVGIVAAWVAASGWRIGDALDFRVGEVDRGRGVIARQQLKTSSNLDYPLSARLADLLDRALKGRNDAESGDHVFLDHRRQPWEYMRLVKVLTHWNEAKWDGPAITFRDLRKSFGSHLAMGGCPPNVLKELLGHSDVALTLSYYVDVDVDKMREWADWHTNPDGGNTH